MPSASAGRSSVSTGQVSTRSAGSGPVVPTEHGAVADEHLSAPRGSAARGLGGGATVPRTSSEGFRGKVAKRHVADWLRRVTEVTAFTHDVRAAVQAGRLDDAVAILPGKDPIAARAC